MSETSTPATTVGAVIYTDGGARPTNPGYAGYGFHGYTYTTDPSTKGSGNAKWNLTDQGYVLKSQKPGQDADEPTKAPMVNVQSYVNGFGTVDGITTNNVAEVVGLTRAIDWVVSQDIQDVKFYTDNKGVVEAATSWIQKWQNNGWVKSNGEPVANKQYLVSLSESMKRLEQKVPSFEYRWIKGHNGDLGNESSDRLATLGTLMAMSGQSQHEVDISPAQGYWSKKIDRPVLMDMKAMYFLTDTKTCIEGEYYIGTHASDEMLGVKAADARFGYVRLNTPDAAIESVRTHVCSYQSEHISLCQILLNKLFKREEYAMLTERGYRALYRSKHSQMNFNYLDKEPVVTEFHPPYLAHRCIEQLNELKGIYLALKAGATDLYIKDITDELFSTHPKKGTSLKPMIGSGLVELDVKMEVFDGKTISVKLQLGHDCLSRNALKHIESKTPKIQVLCWKVSDQHLRYVTHVHTDEGDAVYGAYVSNSVWLKPSIS